MSDFPKSSNLGILEAAQGEIQQKHHTAHEHISRKSKGDRKRVKNSLNGGDKCPVV